MSKLNAGEVTISLNDKEIVLTPTLRAMNLISRNFGGMVAASQAILAQNIDAVVFIIRTGANMVDRDARRLDERVFENGITAELMVALIRFIAILGNGGKPLPDDPGPGAEEQPQGN